MRIFLVGVSCVGKTTVGAKLANLLGYSFFDLDNESESFFSLPIGRLQEQCLTMSAFRQKGAQALTHLLQRQESIDSVIALPPSGLMDSYWRVVKKAQGTIVVLRDEATNILNRITFYDQDSHLIKKYLTTKEKRLYLKKIQQDIAYFNPTYKKADLSVKVSGLDSDQAAKKVKEMLTQHWSVG